MKKLLSASLMCADLTKLGDSLTELKAAGIDYLHLDIMDGSFVPNITLGFDLVNAIKANTDIPLDVHMMVNEPGRFIDRMNLDKNDILCVHYESDIHIHRTLSQIKDKGIKAGLFRPITLYPFPKKELNALADKANCFLSVEMNMGQMVNDIKLAINSKKDVYHYGRTGGMIPSPEEILAKIEEISGGNA